LLEENPNSGDFGYANTPRFGTTDHPISSIEHPAMNTVAFSKPLFDRIHEALTANPHVPNCRQLRIEAADGNIVLEGNVRSFFEKQMAQEAIRRIDGVQMIDNRIEVSWA
jgi:hypothetical protein